MPQRTLLAGKSMNNRRTIARPDRIIVEKRIPQVHVILRRWGVPFKGSMANFWTTNKDDLEYIFKDAQAAYRNMAKRAHSDHGGSHEAMAELNRLWKAIKQRFAEHCPNMEALRRLRTMAAEKESCIGPKIAAACTRGAVRNENGQFVATTGGQLQSKAIRCVETGELFPSISQASRMTGIAPSSLSYALQGDGHLAGKRHWEIVRPVNPKSPMRIA
jgi:hypothetical protein